VPAAQAVELYGVQLQQAKKGTFISAIKKAGLKLIREGGDDNFFDIYDSTDALDGSKQMYVGFVKKSQSFAFAEYEFEGFNQSLMLNRLKKKYGQPNIVKGKFISDTAYFWNDAGIEISYTTDWAKYKTRLLFSQPQALAQLKLEKNDKALKQLSDKMKQQDYAF